MNRETRALGGAANTVQMQLRGVVGGKKLTRGWTSCNAET